MLGYYWLFVKPVLLWTIWSQSLFLWLFTTSEAFLFSWFYFWNNSSHSSGSIIVVTVFIIAFSYIYILFSILKICSTKGRHKAFSTCTSHLTAVTLFFGTITFIYVMPKSSYSTEQNKVVSVIPCWTPSITVSGTRRLKRPWEDEWLEHTGSPTKVIWFLIISTV